MQKVVLINIKIYNKTFSATEISDELGYIQLENLALNKNATAFFRKIHLLLI